MLDDRPLPTTAGLFDPPSPPPQHRARERGRKHHQMVRRVQFVERREQRQRRSGGGMMLTLDNSQKHHQNNSIVSTNNNNNNRSTSCNSSKSSLRKLQKQRRLSALYPSPAQQPGIHPRRLLPTSTTTTRMVEFKLGTSSTTTTAAMNAATTDRHDVDDDDDNDNNRGGGDETQHSRQLNEIKVTADEEKETPENESRDGGSATCRGSTDSSTSLMDDQQADETIKTVPLAIIPHFIAATEDSSPTSPDDEQEVVAEEDNDSSGEEENTSMAGRLIRRSLRLVTPLLRSTMSKSRCSPPPKKRRRLGRDAAGNDVVVVATATRRQRGAVADDHDEDERRPGDHSADVTTRTDDDTVAVMREPDERVTGTTLPKTRSTTPPPPSAAERRTPTVTRRRRRRSTTNSAGLKVGPETRLRWGIADVDEWDEKSRPMAGSSDGESEIEDSDTEKEEEENDAESTHDDDDDDCSGTAVADTSIQTDNTCSSGRTILDRRCRHIETKSTGETEGDESCDQSTTRHGSRRGTNFRSDEKSAKQVLVSSRTTRSRNPDQPVTFVDEKAKAEFSKNRTNKLPANQPTTGEEQIVAAHTEERDTGLRITRSRQRTLPVSILPTGPDLFPAQNCHRRSVRLFVQESHESFPVRSHKNSDQESIGSRLVHRTDGLVDDETAADPYVVGLSSQAEEEPVARRCLSPGTSEVLSCDAHREERAKSTSQMLSHVRLRSIPSRLHDFVCHHPGPLQTRNRDDVETPVALPVARLLRSRDKSARPESCSHASQTSSNLKVESGIEVDNKESKKITTKKRGRPRKTPTFSCVIIVVDGKRSVLSVASTTRRHSNNRDGIKKFSTKKLIRPQRVAAIVGRQRAVTTVVSSTRRCPPPKKTRDDSQLSGNVLVKKPGRPRNNVVAKHLDDPRCVTTRPPLRSDPLLDYTKLTDEYEAMASDNVVKSIRFGATFESACSAVERGIRHYESRTSDVVDPDVVADEKLYRKSLKSHQSFEAQEKLNLLDDDVESIAEDSDQDDKQTMVLMNALADAPIVWSDQVRIRSRQSQCTLACQLCRHAARECCVRSGTTTFTPGITAVDDKDDEVWTPDAEGIHTNTLHALKRLRHSLAFLDGA